MKQRPRKVKLSKPELKADKFPQEVHRGSDNRLYISTHVKNQWVWMSTIDTKPPPNINPHDLFNIREVGSFEHGSGNLIVSDPGYPKKYAYEEPNTFKLSLVIKNAKIGTWKTAVLEGKYTRRIARLIAFIDEISPPSVYDVPNQSKWKCIDTIGVDSGMAGIYDSHFYPSEENTGDYEDESSFYGQASAITDVGILKSHQYAFGVNSHSGFGDGSYNVYVMTQNRKVVAIQIVFIQDLEEAVIMQKH